MAATTSTSALVSPAKYRGTAAKCRTRIDVVEADSLGSADAIRTGRSSDGLFTT